MLEDMCVAINHPGNNKFTLHIYRLVTSRNLLADSSDLSIGDPYIESRVNTLSRIDNTPTF